MIKAILGYDIEPGMSETAYEQWLRDVHIPDLKKIPGLKKIVLNTVREKIRDGHEFYRIAELHYDSVDDFRRAEAWRRENPVAAGRGPDGKTAFRFYLLCDTEEIEVLD
jgi:hypothetical protein